MYPSSNIAAPRSGQHSSGFTLLELMIVVAVIAILAGVVVVRFQDVPDKARQAAAKQDIAAIESALEAYRLDNYVYPSTAQGLAALVSKPSGDPPAPNFKPGGYLRALPKDPWGRPYQYIAPGSRGDFDLYSTGRDGQVGGEGYDQDITNWQSPTP